MSEEDNIAFLISGAYKTTFAQRPVPSSKRAFLRKLGHTKHYG